MSINLSTYAKSSKYLKEDMEVAVHDAALSLDEEYLSEGLLVFDRDEAMNVFKESIKLNTGMTDNEYELVEFQVFDQSNSIFPVEFNSDVVEFQETILYPTVLAILRTKTNKYYFTSDEKDITKAASYTYELRNRNTTNTLLQSIATPEVNNNEPNDKGYYWPAPTTTNITSPYSPNRVHPLTGIVESHDGMDIAIDGIDNDPAVAVMDGVVTFAGVVSGYGKMVQVIHDNDLITRYAHLNSLKVSNGEELSGGDVIGLIGSTGDSTGPHLHFETILNGEHTNPIYLFQ